VTLETCRALEASGRHDDAYRAYLAEGFTDDAARLLIAHGKVTEAADLLLGSVAKSARPLNGPELERLKRALSLLESQNKAERCLQVLAWNGDAVLLGAAAERFGEAGHHLEVGLILARHGDPARGLHWLLRVPKGGASYAAAAVEAVRALVRGAELTMQVDRFLAPFIRRGPDDNGGADAFYALAALYARASQPENAIEVLDRLIERRPTYKDAAVQRERMHRALLGDSDAFARVLDEDAAFDAAVRRPKAPDLLPAPEPASAPAPTPAAPAAPAVPAPVAEARSGEDDTEAATTLSFAAGATVAKRYKIVDVVGRGGMSIVYEAQDLELHETVALKLFTQPTNEEAIERFKQEIRLARQLIHDNIIRVYDLGTTLGARFLTMELLVGEDLHAKMTRGISLREGCNLLAQACDGLDVAHRMGVVHRDIKPENLFVTDQNILKVMDFGIAKQMRQQGLTMAGMVVGTPEYMAPEQAHGHMQVTPAADLYSIGIIMYALATGQLPFRHDEFVPLLLMHVSQAPVPPRRLNSLCPAPVEALILRLLSKRAEERPASAADVAAQLRELRSTGVI
jgi:serine/threonine-protein kinase